MTNINVVDALPDLSHLPIVAVDIENTTGGKRGSKQAVSSDPYRDRILSIQVSDGQTAWILKNNFLSAIPMLTNPEVKKVGHGFSHDLTFLKHHLGGIEISNIYDTLMAERLLTCGLFGVGNDLQAVLARRVGVFKDTATRDQFSNHRGEFTTEQLDYMAKDVLYLHAIREQQLQEIGKAGMGKVLTLENAVVPIIAQMELDGICLNNDLWQRNVEWYKGKKEEIKQRVCKYLNIPFQVSLFGGMEIGINLNSNDQIKDTLAKLDYPLNSTGEAVLQQALLDLPTEHLAHRFITDVLEWRGWGIMLGYAYDEHTNPITGRLHPDWNQQGAKTGRLSCREPNVQQVKNKLAPGEPSVRDIFPPDEGESFAIGDFAQQEPRALADVSGDERMREAAAHTDMYAGLGRAVYGREITKKDPERDQLKVAMLAHFYGASSRKLAYVLGVSEDDAKAFQGRLNTAFPKAAQWGVKQVQSVAQRGFMTSLLGRRCWVKDAVGAAKEDMWQYRSQALNGPMQMTGADIGKEAMRRLYNWKITNGYKDVKIRVAMHDELVVTAPTDQIQEVLYNMIGAMESAMESICPNVRAKVDAHIDTRWTKG